MTEPALAWTADLDARARQSLGSSDAEIYRLVKDILERHGALGGLLVDAGCGCGGLLRALGHAFGSCCGLDAVAYEGFPPDAAFHRVDLNADDWGVAVRGDVVAAVETIEHLENPWAFLRRLAAMARPGGWVVVTTPNQLSVLSLATLIVKHRFSAFQDVHCPAHRTALLPSDLCRLATASGLQVVDVAYSLYGRVPLSPWHYPGWWARRAPRLWSDNVALLARKPHA